MNLSFSTRGWNHLSWDEQVRDAEEMGFQGIEPYNIQEYPSLSGRGGAFHAYMQNETIRTLRKSGLLIP
jgi:fatty-acyl-CoA synthase